MTASKRKVFISYHHGGDQVYTDWLSTNLGDQLDLFIDRSLDQPIDSTNTVYVSRKIREDYILGSSITIVLCGANTWKRRYVDWEIHSTLHHQHALLGIALPTATRNNQNQIIVPDRLHANIQAGYAHWIEWNQNWVLYPSSLKDAIEEAIRKSNNKSLINNSQEKMKQNLP
jgi:hypothetical protein